MREKFEADAAPKGYDLIRAECGCCDYANWDTEQSWHGFIAGYEAALRTHENGGQESEAGAVSIGWVNLKYGTFFNLAQIAATERNAELINSGEIVQVFTSRPSAPAIEYAVIMKCMEKVNEWVNPYNDNAAAQIVLALEALIPQDGRTQLASFTERAVAAGMNAANEFYYGKSEEVSSSDIAERLVTNLIGAAK